MANINKAALLEEYKLLTNLLQKHKENEKNKEMMKKENVKTVQQNYQKVPPQKYIKHQPNASANVVNISAQSVSSFSKNYVNPSNLSRFKTIANKSYKVKYVSSKTQSSKYICPANKHILNKEALSTPKRTVLCPKKKVENVPTKLINNPKNIHSSTKIIKEIEYLTELLKKNNSANKLLKSTKNESNVQNQLPVCIKGNEKNNFKTCNKYKTVKFENVSAKTNVLSNFPSKVAAGTSLSKKLNENVYIKLNLNKKDNHINYLRPKLLDHSKYSYKKVSTKLDNSKMTSNFLQGVERKTQMKGNSTKLGSHIRIVTCLDSKKPSVNLSVHDSISVLAVKPSFPDTRNLAIKFTPKDHNKLLKETSVEKSYLSKVKTDSHNSSNVPKSKLVRSSFSKINKRLTPPTKSTHKTSFSAKRMKKKVNTKYKVVNKSLTPCLKTKEMKLHLVNNSGSKQNSAEALDESDSFLRKLNCPTMDKLEQDLLAISTALTSTPLPSKKTKNVFKSSHSKANVTLRSKKTFLKKPKARITKYKVVNSDFPNRYTSKSNQNYTSMKMNFKSVGNSKFSLINERLQPVCISTPMRQKKSLLVKRLYKSKNTIINKNSSSTSFRAKMIKSKYLTLNKRKIHSWQKHAVYKVPYQHQLKERYLRSKSSHLPIRYQKAVTSVYHPKLLKRFPTSHYSTINRQFGKTTDSTKYKKKLKQGYMQSPVVYIHGMKYSRNSSGKTLKKLPAKGQTTKIVRKLGTAGKSFLRSPENTVKISTPTTNLASRVLHRSISRIISASSKKSLTKVNTYCMFYNRFGRCNRGVKCTYIHDPSKIAVCTRFLRGTCKVSGCPFSHEIAPGKMAICSFFLVGACEKENCPYRHEKLLPNAELCKAFVQGYCPHGKECKKAHILICPKHIQGDCDKGSSCAFPHPPKKVKKNVQKEVEEDDKEKKFDDVLEKVSRYFLQSDDCLSKTNQTCQFDAAKCVPKQRKKLEEQPAFIPLSESFTSKDS